MDYIKQLNWRYATKRMNGRKIPQEKIDRILEAIRLSASSMGLQPYNVIVIEDEEVRKKIQPAIYNQPQILEGSHLLVFAVWNDISEQKIKAFIRQVSDDRKLSVESLNGLKEMIQSFVTKKEKDAVINWSARQAYIALGSGLIAAAMEEVDSTPMEGFEPEALDKLLRLEEKGLKSVALLALGFRDSDKDKLSEAKKVRRPSEEFFIKIDSLD